MKLKLWQKVFLGLILGVILGFCLKENAVILKPLGDVFIRMIKMIIVPLIFFAIVSGMTSTQDTKTLSSISIKAVVAYVVTTVVAITIGLSVGVFMQPGAGMNLNLTDTRVNLVEGEHWGNKIASLLLNIIPDNALGAMAQGSIIQVVFFALFVGFIINRLDEAESKRMASIFQVFSKVVFSMIKFIIQLSPLAACTLTAWVVGTQGISVLWNLATLVGCTYMAFGLQYLVFGLMIYVWTGLSPKPFFQKSFEYQLMAFSTSSSKAALSTTMSVCRYKLGVSKTSSSFVLPLGAAINMDGIAIYLGLCAVFFAQAIGWTLTTSDYAIIVLTCTLGSIGGAGIPGGSMVMLPMVLGAVGLPIEGVALIAGVDRIIDMMRTVVSITGDATVTLCVDHSEGLHNSEIYYQESPVVKPS